MPNRNKYLEILRSYGKSEADVLPMIDMPDSLRPYAATALTELAASGVFKQSEIARIRQDCYQPLTSNDLIARHFEQLGDDLDRSGIQYARRTFAGVYPFKSFGCGGECRKVEGGHVLLINTGCIEMLEAVGSVYCSTAPDKAGIIASIVQSFSKTLRVLPNPASYDAPGIDESNPARVKTLAYLLNEAHKFVLAHELAHATMNHPKTDSLSELQADAWATLVLLKRNRVQSLPEVGDSLTFAGAILFLALTDWLSPPAPPIKHATVHPEASSHPALLTRIQLVVGIAGELDMTLGRFELGLVETALRVRELLKRPPLPKVSDDDDELCGQALSTVFAWLKSEA